MLPPPSRFPRDTSRDEIGAAEEGSFRILCVQKHYKYSAFSSEWLRILTNISVSAFWGSQKPSADIGASELLLQNNLENHICKQLATSTDRQVDAKRYFVVDFHYVFQRFRILHAQNAHHSNNSKSKRARAAPQQHVEYRYCTNHYKHTVFLPCQIKQT